MHRQNIDISLFIYDASGVLRFASKPTLIQYLLENFFPRVLEYKILGQYNILILVFDQCCIAIYHKKIIFKGEQKLNY